jgi:hypothetical protein
LFIYVVSCFQWCPSLLLLLLLLHSSNQAAGIGGFAVVADWDDKEEDGKDALQQWEDDWDDDDVTDDFSVQLRKELESASGEA